MKLLIGEHKFQNLATTALLTLLFKFSYAGWGILVSVLLARWLGPREFGVYVYIMALIALFNVPAAFGLPTLLVREIAAYKINGQIALLRGLITASFAFALIASSLMGMLVVLICSIIGDQDVQNVVSSDWAAIAGISIFTTLGLIRASVLRGLSRVLVSQVPDIFIAPSIFVILLTIFIILDETNINAALVFQIQLVSVTISFLVASIYILKSLPAESKNQPREYEHTRWMRTAFLFMLVGGAQVINAKMDVMMVGSMLGSTQAGLYQVSTKAADLLLFVYLAFGTVAGPRLSELHTRGDMAAIQELLSRGGWWLNIGSAGIGMVLIVSGPWLIGLVFGVEYQGAYIPFAILCGFRLVFSIFGLCDLTLQIIGSGSLVAKTLIVATSANIMLNAILIPKYGINGAAFATGLTLTSWNIYLSYRLRKSYGLRASLVG